MTQELDSVLMLLADESRPVRTIDLFQLSDIGRNRLADFAVTWRGLSEARRLELISQMVEQAETNIHFNFHIILRSVLTDADPAVRKLAVEGLWEDEKANLIGPLVTRMWDDESVEVRAAAAISLGRFVLLGVFDEIGEDALRPAEQGLREVWFRAGEVNEVRRRALESLAYGTTHGLNEMIYNAYYDEDASMRHSAMFAMGRTTDARWSRFVLEEIISDDPAMRFEAAQAAGEMGLKAAVRPLIERLDDVDSSVREAAVVALGKIGGAPAKRALQHVAQGDDEALVQAAEEALEILMFSASSLEKVLPDFDGPLAASADLDFDAELIDFDDDEEDDKDEEFDFDDLDEEFGLDAFETDEEDLDWDDDDSNDAEDEF